MSARLDRNLRYDGDGHVYCRGCGALLATGAKVTDETLRAHGDAVHGGYIYSLVVKP